MRAARAMAMEMKRVMAMVTPTWAMATATRV
jgi:hypothetical protein